MTPSFATRTRVLPVPYFVQPTSDTCQSTCLKMMAAYLEEAVVFQSTGGGTRAIGDIWRDINIGPQRPVQARNAHRNMMWWLQHRFPLLRFEYHTLTDETRVTERIVGFIDAGIPVIVSVSHARVKGHIVLIVGYESYSPALSSPHSASSSTTPTGASTRRCLPAHSDGNAGAVVCRSLPGGRLGRVKVAESC